MSPPLSYAAESQRSQVSTATSTGTIGWAGPWITTHRAGGADRMYPAHQRQPLPRASPDAAAASGNASPPPYALPQPPASTLPRADAGAQHAAPARTPSMMQWSVGAAAGPRRGGVPPSPSVSPPRSRSPSRRLGGQPAAATLAGPTAADRAPARPAARGAPTPIPLATSQPNHAVAHGLDPAPMAATNALRRPPWQDAARDAPFDGSTRHVATPMDRLKQLSISRHQHGNADASASAMRSERHGEAAVPERPAELTRRTRALQQVQPAVRQARALEGAHASAFMRANGGGAEHAAARQHSSRAEASASREPRGGGRRQPRVSPVDSAVKDSSADDRPAVAAAPHATFEAKLAEQLRQQAADEPAGSSTTRTCPTCSRSFNPEAFGKHVGICKKVFVQKRNAFDSKAARAPEGAQELQRELPANLHSRQQRGAVNRGSLQRRGGAFDARPAKAAGATKGSWKQKSETLRAAMRANRSVALLYLLSTSAKGF